MTDKQESKEALKSTGIVGGGQIIIIIINLIKGKIIALILGPSGIGIVGLLTTALDMIRNISSVGLPFSGVRDISILSTKNDKAGLAKIIKVFNTWMFYSGLLGMCLALIGCKLLSQLLFNNDNYAISIAVLAITILLTTISLGWTAVMQGKRAIALMVKSNITANVISCIIVTLVYLIFKEKGIIPSFIIASVVNFFVGYYFYKKLDVPPFSKISFLDSWLSAKGMIRIGVFTIVVSSFDQVMSLLLRAFISDKAGISGVGLFTAANTIANFYLAIVLSSMASDYYPKLAAIQDDNLALQKSINSQLHVVLLLATPIIIGMVGFGDVAINLFYSHEFVGAVAILEWQILGDFFKIIAWPFGYILLAKGLGKLYMGYSISYTILNMAIIYFGWPYMGFLGIGISFFISQLISLMYIYLYSYWKFNIYIDIYNLKIITIWIIALTLTFLTHHYITGIIRHVISSIILLQSVLFSIYHLNKILNLKAFFMKTVQKFIKK